MKIILLYWDIVWLFTFIHVAYMFGNNIVLKKKKKSINFFEATYDNKLHWC